MFGVGESLVAEMGLTAIFQNQLNGGLKALLALVDRAALSIRAEYLRAVSEKPLIVFFYNCRELIVHGTLRLRL